VPKGRPSSNTCDAGMELMFRVPLPAVLADDGGGSAGLGDGVVLRGGRHVEPRLGCGSSVASWFMTISKVFSASPSSKERTCRKVSNPRLVAINVWGLLVSILTLTGGLGSERRSPPDSRTIRAPSAPPPAR